MKKICLAALLALAFLGVTSARAELKNIYTSMTGPQLTAILQAKGYQAKLDADSVGDPVIFSGTEGVHYQIWFSGCDKSPVRSCKLIEFWSEFKNDKNYAPADANRCNSQFMFGRVHTADTSIYVTWGVPISNADDEYIQAAFDEWSVLLNIYQTCMSKQRQ